MCSEQNDKGFTLVEIAIAVAILGVALVTLVGLQTRMLDTYFIEKNRVKASLYAQYLMAMVEVQPEPPEVGNESRDLKDALEDAGYFDKEGFERADQTIEGWRYTRQVVPLGLPVSGGDVMDDALRRVDIVIEWGPSDDEEFDLTYFINMPISPDLAQAGGGGTGAGGQGTGGSGGGTGGQ